MLKIMFVFFIVWLSAWGVVPAEPTISVSAKCLTMTVPEGQSPIVYLEIINNGKVDVVVNLNGLSISPLYEFPDGAMEIINATALNKPALAGGTASFNNWYLSTNVVGIGPGQKIFRVMELPTPRRSNPRFIEKKVSIKVSIEVSFFAGKFYNNTVDDWVWIKRKISTPLMIRFK